MGNIYHIEFLFENRQDKMSPAKGIRPQTQSFHKLKQNPNILFFKHFKKLLNWPVRS